MNEKRKRFCEEYIKDWNGAAAARRAGYSKNTSKRRAWEALQEPDVQEYLGRLTSEVRERNEIEVDNLVSELKKMAFTDIGKIFGSDGELLPINQIDEDTRRAISEFQVKEIAGKFGISVDKKAKLHSKLEAIEKLMRYLGAYEKDNEQKGHLEIQGKSTDELRAEIAAIRKRRQLTEEE